MDELGYFADPGTRLGYLDAQQLRAVRVVIDIGGAAGAGRGVRPPGLHMTALSQGSLGLDDLAAELAVL